jgi:hypothetical protein
MSGDEEYDEDEGTEFRVFCDASQVTLACDAAGSKPSKRAVATPGKIQRGGKVPGILVLYATPCKSPTDLYIYYWPDRSTSTCSCTCQMSARLDPHLQP